MKIGIDNKASAWTNFVRININHNLGIPCQGISAITIATLIYNIHKDKLTEEELKYLLSYLQVQ